MAPKIPDKMTCPNCGEFIFSSQKLQNGEYVETHSRLPVILRILDHGIQFICPNCGRVEPDSLPEVASNQVSRVFVAPQIPEDRLKLRSVVLDAEHATYRPKTGTLDRVADAFAANVSRVVALGEVVALTSGLGALEASIYQQSYSIVDAGGPAPPPELVSLSLRHADIYKSLSNHRLEAMSNGTSRISAWAYYHADIETGLEAMFSSQIVGAWTAIETLLSDLWETSINVHPKGLGDLRGAPKRISKRTSSQPQKSEQNQATTRDWKVSLADLTRVTRGDYDLSSSLGTLLRDNFTFARLEGIREAYSCAFFERSEKIDAALTKDGLDAISIARNVLVHRAGKADLEYVARAKNIPSLPKLSVGTQFPLDAEISARLIKAAIAASVELISAVDTWIATH